MSIKRFFVTLAVCFVVGFSIGVISTVTEYSEILGLAAGSIVFTWSWFDEKLSRQKEHIATLEQIFEESTRLFREDIIELKREIVEMRSPYLSEENGGKL